MLIIFIKDNTKKRDNPACQILDGDWLLPTKDITFMPLSIYLANKKYMRESRYKKYRDRPTRLSRYFFIFPAENYPPKLSYIIDSGSTPSPSSMETTALDIGPGPHM